MQKIKAKILELFRKFMNLINPPELKVVDTTVGSGGGGGSIPEKGFDGSSCNYTVTFHDSACGCDEVPAVSLNKDEDDKKEEVEFKVVYNYDPTPPKLLKKKAKKKKKAVKKIKKKK